VSHYYPATDEDIEIEQCISEKVDQGLSYAEAVKECREQSEKNQMPATDVEPEEIYSGLDMCVDVRCLGGESKSEARSWCLRMFKDDNIKAAFENDADPEIIAELVHNWECEYHPKGKWFRDYRDREERQHEAAVKKRMEELKNDSTFHYQIESDLREAAEHKLGIENYQRAHDYSKRSTIGDVYGKTREQIISEDTGHKPKRRLTVGDLYGKSRKQILADAQPEQTPLDRCVKNRMETRGETYKEALEWCKLELEK